MRRKAGATATPAGSEAIFSSVSCKTTAGSRGGLMPIISKKEKTRNGVAPQTSGSNCGTASMSATVVVPVRNSILAPSSHDSAKSE